MTPDPRPTAAMVAIGDELLSGRTRDANMHALAKWLDARGVAFIEARVVPDQQAAIVEAVNALRRRADHVFTSGGIGPTHDDITADAIAHAFGLTIDVRADALAILADWYGRKGEEVTDARSRMARIPHSAALIANAVSGAPGFSVENVHVMAGVPTIFNAMLEALDSVIPHGKVLSVVTVSGTAQESRLAAGLAALEQALYGLKIGSYPGKSGTSGRLAIVCKAADPALAARAADAVEGLFRAIGAEPTRHDGFGPELE